MSLPVAAITLEYRGPLKTIRCVESLLAEGVGIVLILDNSADGGVSVQALRLAFDGNDKVMIIDGDRNLGFAAGINKALSILRELVWKGRVLLINNDARLATGAIGTMSRSMDTCKGAAMAHPTILHAGTSMALTYYHPATGRLSYRARRGWLPYASGCCLLISPEFVRRPLFDETFFMYGEDVELSARLRGHGRPVVYVPEALVVHEGSGGSGVNTLFYETHMVAGHVILASRLATSLSAQRCYLVGRLAFLSARAVVRAARYVSTIPLKGLVCGWRLGSKAVVNNSPLDVATVDEDAMPPHTR
jgi:GT2 family glycosyltransferase